MSAFRIVPNIQLLSKNLLSDLGIWIFQCFETSTLGQNLDVILGQKLVF